MRRWTADRFVDLAVTLICWLYFTLGFLFLFAPFYLWSGLFQKDKARAFQRYNRLFYRWFFRILHAIAPRQHWEIDATIGSLRGSVILCNHRSYLDPLLLIAYLDRAATIVKSVFFAVPIFGWVIRTSGYLPATATGRFAALMLTQMESLPAYLALGGNLFVFPEGTRSRDGRIAPIHHGALKIARQCRVPVHVLVVENTDRLFTPGIVLFAASQRNWIRLRFVETITIEDLQCSLGDLSQRVRRAMEGQQHEAAS